MTYEERYLNAREKYLTTCNTYMTYPSASNLAEWQAVKAEFNALCIEILEVLMEENSDVLQRLKTI